MCCWRLGESCSCAVREDVSLRGAGERDGAWGDARLRWETGGCRTTRLRCHTPGCRWVELEQELHIQRVPPQEPREAQTLVCRFHSRCAPDCLSQVLTDVQTKKFEMLHHLHLLSSRLTHQNLCAVFPEVWKQFFLCVRDCWGWLCRTHTYNPQTAFPQSSHWAKCCRDSVFPGYTLRGWRRLERPVMGPVLSLVYPACCYTDNNCEAVQNKLPAAYY